MTDSRITAAGSERGVRHRSTAVVREIDLGGRRVIPSLNDSHTHLIRSGLSYNMELRW